MSEEQPVEIIDNHEAVNVAPSNNTDTLSIKQKRQEAANELGISYVEALNMSAKQLQQKIAEKNDPSLLHSRLFLEANSRAANEASDTMAAVNYMTSDTPESTPDTAKDLTLVTNDAPTEVSNVVKLPVAQESADKETKKRKPNVRQLAAAALIAITAVGGAIGATNKSNDGIKVSSNENADSATADSQNKQTTDNIFDLIKFNPKGFNEKDYNGSEQHAHDRMSTEGAFDGEKRNIAELDNHVLAKIKNNPSLMAAVLEVRESGNKDANFSVGDVNTDTRKFSVHGENGQYSAKGQDAQDTLQRSWDRGNQGKVLSKNDVNELMSKYVFINHGTNEGAFQNSVDDKTYSAGVFDYRPDLGDKIYAKKLGNGETVYFKVNKKDATRDCLNVQTLRLIGDVTTTPGTPSTPTPGTPGEDITLDLDGKYTPPEWPTTEKPGLTPKDPTKDSNLSHGDTDGTLFPPGEQKPATDPPAVYTPPAAPEAPTTPNSQPVPNPEPSSNPGTAPVGSSK